VLFVGKCFPHRCLFVFLHDLVGPTKATAAPTIATAAPTNVPSPLPTSAPTTLVPTTSLPTLAPTILLASDESISNGNGNGNNGNGNGNGNSGNNNEEDEDEDEGPKFLGHEIPLSAWRTIDGNIRPGKLHAMYDILQGSTFACWLE